MNLEPGWLKRRLKEATDTFNSWPEEMQERYTNVVNAMFEESREEAEHRFINRRDSQRYGNY